MSQKTGKFKLFWKIVGECLIHTIIPAIMYFAASAVLMLILMKSGTETEIASKSEIVVWSIVCGVVAVGYNGVITFAIGGQHFEMLVSGNMKRRSAMENGYELNISSHKFEKEYRPWKGFVIGFLSAWAVIVGCLIAGANREAIQAQNVGKGTSILLLIVDLLAGWAIMPFQLTNANLYLPMLVVIFPTVVSGACYIWGAYHKRNSTLRKQDLERQKAEAQANKPRKINYGGLPGTKPKKHK